MLSRVMPTAGLAAATIVAGADSAGRPAGSARAAQSTLSVKCDGRQHIARVNTNHSSGHGGWGTGQVAADSTGHLVATFIGVGPFDDAINQTLLIFE